MCFQEMEYKIYVDYWAKFMEEKNFGSIFERKLAPTYWDRNLTMMDGVSIFYNKEKVKLLNYERIEFTSFFQNPKFFEQTKDTRQRLVSRNTVALVAVLEHIETHEVLFVANTHLYWSPRHEDVKLMQTYELTELVWKAVQRYYHQCCDKDIQEQMESSDGVNIILAGDFNSAPDSMVSRYLVNGNIDITKEKQMQVYDYGSTVGPELLDRLGRFNSPYKDLYDKGTFTRTAYLPRFKRVIDYIWLNEHSKRLKVTKILDELGDQDLPKYLGFPNPDYPSDHLPIVTQFEVTKDESTGDAGHVAYRSSL
ncbi:DEKNAAC100302 [Brettanomyces naardenensis]|uniref:DEKNAAC100302 n=1 Tax=Brettanomyces naardenensis TaxID=13370 RepID=A0A448YFY8_BRENA|nr:DEKNAAC100302 [Brettanomyces naardenensis]